jgi:sulfate adenylyltransferase subunit 2
MTVTALTEARRVDELRLLEAEGVHIIREVVAELQRPVLLFSAGKDSIVLLRLAEKAFRPLPLPFPVMHVDTGHNFPEVIEFRDRRVTGHGHKLIVASVQESTTAACPTPVPGLHATGHRPAPCSTRWKPVASTQRSGVPAATRSGPAPKNGS